MVGTIKLGVIGTNEGNGHPFSFSAIINGFDHDGMRASGWDVIYNYLKIRDVSEFGFENVMVSHAWTQDPQQTAVLANASRIPNVVEEVTDMVDVVDGVIIARDDHEQHYGFAKPFLESGKYVFVDKPLSLDIQELRYFRDYLEAGQLMSCAAARYAKELDEVRGNADTFGEMKLIRGTVINSLERYGIHMLDGIFGVTGCQVERVSCFGEKNTSLILKNRDGSRIFIDALGTSAKTLQFDFWSDSQRFHAEANDNFSMFRRLLAGFIQMIRTGTPAIEPDLVINAMRILIAANRSLKENREIDLDEIKV